MIIKKYDDGYVDYSCDNCNKIVHIKYNSLVSRKRLKKQYCRKCSIKLNDVVNKRKETCLDKYGFDNPMKVEDIAKQRKKSMIVVHDRQRTNINDIKKSFEAEGYKLLTTEYKNNKQSLDYICSKGHKSSISWNSWINGRRCRLCSSDKIKEKLRYSIDYVRQELAKEGYELLSENYINRTEDIFYKCPVGHIGDVSFGNWVSNRARCSSCACKESKAELDLIIFISEYFKNIITSDRKIIAPYELDIVIPEKKVAIEYCGLFWHSEKMGKDKTYHLRKLNMCNEKGYDLITIFEDEWINKQEIVKRRLLYKLGVSDSERIPARKCYIKEIDSKLKNKFLEENHLQGSDKSSVRLGAFYNDKLIAVMTFGVPNISRISKYEWELNRFCTNKNIISSGIASKLFKFFVNKYKPFTVITYGDKRWSKGNLYKNLGFKYLHDSKPNYWYFYNASTKRLHRFGFRKSILKNKIKNFNQNLTEQENMKNNNYHRIYDCGNVVWLYKKD